MCCWPGTAHSWDTQKLHQLAEMRTAGAMLARARVCGNSSAPVGALAHPRTPQLAGAALVEAMTGVGGRDNFAFGPDAINLLVSSRMAMPCFCSLWQEAGMGSRGRGLHQACRLKRAACACCRCLISRSPPPLLPFETEGPCVTLTEHPLTPAPCTPPHLALAYAACGRVLHPVLRRLHQAGLRWHGAARHSGRRRWAGPSRQRRRRLRCEGSAGLPWRGSRARTQSTCLVAVCLLEREEDDSLHCLGQLVGGVLSIAWPDACGPMMQTRPAPLPPLAALPASAPAPLPASASAAPWRAPCWALSPWCMWAAAAAGSATATSL